jgi:hypothetical protein
LLTLAALFLQRNSFPPVIGRTPFRISLASLLALVVLAFGLADPILGLAEALEDHAPTKCISLAPDQDHAPAMVFTGQDLGDETPDLEQLLQPFESLTMPRKTGALAFSSPRGLLPPHLSPPRLRPPIFLA